VYLRDSGIVHALLGVESLEDLLGHPVVGQSWEGFVLESLVASAGDARTSYFRTSAGAEIDLVIEGRGGARLAIEIKRSTAPTVSRGFRSACDDIRATDRMVVYSGAEEIPLGDGLNALNLRAAVKRIEDST
jgi:predicted AAA+ superfamily ATPase